jgi:hypothetical protein
VAALLTVVLALGAGAIGGRLSYAAESSSSATAQQPTRPPVAFDGETFDIAEVVSRLEKSVVSIDTTVVSRRGRFVTEGEGAGTGGGHQRPRRHPYQRSRRVGGYHA